MCDYKAENKNRTIAEIVREKTNDGELIVDFLTDMVVGKIDGATLWHRLEATRQLQKLGLVIPKAVAPQANESRTSRASGESRQSDELADIIRQKTDGGNDIVQFLIDAMQGRIEGFMPRHRLAASDRLIERGFDKVPVQTVQTRDDRDKRPKTKHVAFEQSEYVDPRTPEQRDPESPEYVRPSDRMSNPEDAPFDLDNYDMEQYWLDSHGNRALRHIYGGSDAAEVGHLAVGPYRIRASIQKLKRDRDFTPIQNPEDDPYGKGHYGYKALCVKYGDNDEIRIASRAVAEYYRREFGHLLKEDGSLKDTVDTASIDPQSLQYLERSRHLLADHGDNAHEDPNHPGSIVIRSREYTPAPEPPPDEKRVKNHPHQRGDPGEIRIPLRDVSTTTISLL